MVRDACLIAGHENKVPDYVVVSDWGSDSEMEVLEEALALVPAEVPMELPALALTKGVLE